MKSDQNKKTDGEKKAYSGDELETALTYLDPSQRELWIRTGMPKSCGVKYFNLF